ncbi:MAG: helix-turn-helix domain-containing protein [Deltaproteobacteria bacterium]|nr:helix-turn-helix domain-containing protein [Deltaproteobacteria bacterium]
MGKTKAEVRPEAQEFFTVAEVAARWRLSRASIYRLMASGQLAWVQIGGARRIARAEVERLERGGS